MPIALLLDLYDRDGPSSHEIYRSEAVADDVVREAAALEEAEADAAAADRTVDFTDRRADW